MASRDSTVLFSTPEERRVENPYISLLTRAVEEAGWHVARFSWVSALFGRYRAFHVHWPEGLIVGQTRPRSLIKQFLLLLLMVRLSMTNVTVVRTIHNASPHDMQYGKLGRFLTWLLDRRTDTWIHLSAYSVEEMHHSHDFFIPHGSYVEWFAQYSPVVAGMSAVDVLYFGQVRPYKGVEQLITAASEAGAAVRVLVAGKAIEKGYADEIGRCADGIDGVELRLEFIPDGELWSLLNHCVLVVLPFREIWNSGSLLLALSAGRPVLISDSLLAREFEDEFGAGWVRRFSGSLTGEELLEAVRWARARTESGTPSFARRLWNEIGMAHASLYQGTSRVDEYGWRERSG